MHELVSAKFVQNLCFFIFFTSSIEISIAADQPCIIQNISGCYLDDNNKRVLNFTAEFHTNPSEGNMTLENCAHLCCKNGFSPSSLFGVEFGSQCFCGRDWAPGVTPVKEPDANCQQYKCPGDTTGKEHCGGSDRILIFHAKTCPCGSDPPPSPPLFHGCLEANATKLPYCDASRSHSDRADNLLSLLSLDEQISMLSPTIKPYCACHTPAIDHVGLPKYKWLTETNTMVNGPCISSSKCPTCFVGPTGMAASFNRSSWWLKGDVVSTDMRVLNAHAKGEVGLTGFGPNINLVKDPRYGRNSELAGEDPFLSGSYAVAYTQGMQQVDENGQLKMLNYLKHYTAYSVEAHRFTFKANVSLFDFWDSYLPQYEMAFTKGEHPASGAMCSYFAPNGISMCGNNWLLNQVVRGNGDPSKGGVGWNRPDAVIMSDCSAVNNMRHNGYATTEVDASAKALNGGLDVYGGWNDDLWTQGYLHQAVTQGLVKAADVTRAAKRTVMQKLKVGLFDPVVDKSGKPTKWIALGSDISNINSTYSQQVSYEAALQAPVLLKNDGNILPITNGKKIAVVGPMAVEKAGLLSDYAKPQSMPSCGVNCMDTIGIAINRANSKGSTLVEKGVDVSSSNTSNIDAALKAVEEAEVVVLVLGITKSQEHEGIDRGSTTLPGLQESFAHQVLNASIKDQPKPVILILCSGGILSVDSLVIGSKSLPGAIIEAFNPAVMGPRALADLILGNENRWGKLPVTIYPQNYTAAIKITDMSFPSSVNGIGRGYRYFKGQPLFAFGAGLSYTTFKLSCAASTSNKTYFSFECTVSNTGHRRGDEVVQVYHSVSTDIAKQCDHPVPIKRLVEFERISIEPNENVKITFNIPLTSMRLTTNSGKRVIYPGKHFLTFSRGHGTDVQIELMIKS